MPDRKSVSIAGDGIEIGRLQIHMDEKRTSHIKNQILEARFDEPATLEQTGIGRKETQGWRILRDSIKRSQHELPVTGAESRSSLINQLNVRTSKLSLGPRNSRLSMGGGQKVPTMRKSACHIIQEEGPKLTEESPKQLFAMNAQQPGWKVLRESIKRKEFKENLSLRKSTLQLHSMDECAFNRNSQIGMNSRRMSGTLDPGVLQSMHPSIQNNAQEDEPIKTRYGYSEVSVAHSRRRSTITGSLTSNANSMHNDLEYLLRISHSKHNEKSSKRCLCPCLPRLHFRKISLTNDDD